MVIQLIKYYSLYILLEVSQKDQLLTKIFKNNHQLIDNMVLT